MCLKQGMTLGRVKVGCDHLLAHLLHTDLRHPAEPVLGPGRIAEQRFDLSRTEIAWINTNEDVTGLDRRGIIAFDLWSITLHPTS